MIKILNRIFVGRGEVSFTPQFKCENKIQKNKKKDKLKTLIKKEEIEDKISEEELKLTLALAEKISILQKVKRKKKKRMKNTTL